MDATIHDVNSTGMLLRLPMSATEHDDKVLPLGSALGVVFAPDHANAPDETVRLSVVVSRRQLPTVGGRLVDTNKEQRRALRILAMLAVESRAMSNSSTRDAVTRPYAGIDPRAIMAACRKVIKQRLPRPAVGDYSVIIKRIMPMMSELYGDLETTLDNNNVPTSY